VLIQTALAVPANLRTALEAHMAGFLAKDTPAAELIHAIRVVTAGDRVIDPALALVTLETRPSPLTDREADVLRLPSEGLDPRHRRPALPVLRHGPQLPGLGDRQARRPQPHPRHQKSPPKPTGCEPAPCPSEDQQRPQTRQT
jgi:hypothetical protein